MQDAAAPVEQPDVEALLPEVLGEVRVDRVGREQPAARAHAVHEHDRTAVAAAVAQQLELDVVVGLDRVHLGHAAAQRALHAGRRVGVERA